MVSLSIHVNSKHSKYRINDVNNELHNYDNYFPLSHLNYVSFYFFTDKV